VAKSKLIVADPKNGKSTMYELNDDQFRIFKGLKIGNEIDGSSVNVEGKLTITGGSDNGGFPMRSDVLGGVKKHVLLSKGIGFRSNQKGIKRRKLVRGNTITEEIHQINAILISKPPKKSPTKKKEAYSDIKLTSKEKGKETPKKEVITKKETNEKQGDKLSETKSVPSTKKKMKATKNLEKTTSSKEKVK
jgi:small subunit ribosomal protein S6e|tara:strand:- start:233 stop:805 length:573 start_codon:yes stop_codon:yes gene_type:complete